jgi:phage tail sheath protein FI
MASQLGSGASDITTEEVEPQIRPIQGVETAVLGAVGIAERGPINQATLVTSFPEYQSIFGGDTGNSDLTHSARGFFLEGGQTLQVTRIVHLTDVATPASKTSAAATGSLDSAAVGPYAGSSIGSNVGPFNLEPGDNLNISIDGAGAATATFTATAAERISGAGPFALTNGMTLTLSANGGSLQTITFLTSEFVSIGAATRAEVAAVINAKSVDISAFDTGAGVRLRTDRRGTGSSLNVTGGTSNGQLAFTTGSVAGTGNVANIDAVTVAEVKTVVELAVAGCTVVDVGGLVRINSNTTGGSSSVQVLASSTADDELGFDNAAHPGGTGAAVPTLGLAGAYDGAYANRIQVRIQNAANGEASRFDLVIINDGVTSKPFSNLTMDELDDRYVEKVMNAVVGGSQLIAVTDLGMAGTTLERRPANGTSALLSGGNDGLVGIIDNDFVGSPTGKTGLYALDLVEDLSLLIVPGRATATMHNAMITYAEVHREGTIFEILDPPANMTAQQIVTYVEDTAALLQSTEFAAMYWPRVKVSNPSRAVFGPDEQIVVPPSGHIAGVFARTDASRLGGVYQPPAGTERGILRSILGFETDEVKDKTKRDLVFPKRINPLTTKKGLPRYIDGSRTLKSNGNFPYIAERRGVIFIERSIKDGIQWARHSNNTPELRRRVERTIRLFLKVQMNQDAFRSKDPEKAFYCDFADALNTDAMVFAGQMEGFLGLATNKPAEFIRIKVTQDTRALELEAAS